MEIRTHFLPLAAFQILAKPVHCPQMSNLPESRSAILRSRILPRLARFIPLLTLAGLALLPLCLGRTVLAQAAVEKPLLIYFIDVEGGQATLLVAPSGASLLIDTGWPTPDGRDARRILAAMHDAGIARIDHLLITHFHVDHVGGVPELVKRVSIGEFLDHGINRENSEITRRDFAAYLKVIGDKSRRILHPGDTIQLPGLEITVLTADGEHIDAVPGIRPVPNPFCAGEPAWLADETENARSVGLLVHFGHFHFLDLGDLTKAKEIALVCPANPIGTVDLYH